MYQLHIPYYFYEGGCQVIKHSAPTIEEALALKEKANQCFRIAKQYEVGSNEATEAEEKFVEDFQTFLGLHPADGHFYKLSQLFLLSEIK